MSVGYKQIESDSSTSIGTATTDEPSGYSRRVTDGSGTSDRPPMGRLCPGLQPNVAEVRENNPLYRFGCGVPDENAVAHQELLSSTDAISHRFISYPRGHPSFRRRGGLRPPYPRRSSKDESGPSHLRVIHAADQAVGQSRPLAREVCPNDVMLVLSRPLLFMRGQDVA